MSTKLKAFIGVTLSFIVLIILFTSNRGFRAARLAEEEAHKKENACAAGETSSSQSLEASEPVL